MPEKEQKTNSLIKKFFLYIAGAFIFFIMIRLILDGFSFKNVIEILIVLGLFAALFFVYAIGYFIVIIYEKIEKRRNG